MQFNLLSKVHVINIQKLLEMKLGKGAYHELDSRFC